MKLRVAIVGCGVGRLHAAAYQQLPDHFEIAAVCDIDRERARATATSLGGQVAALGALEEACNDRDIDVVDVCTPPGAHVDNVADALAAGKHVICEKPLAAALADVDRLAQVAESSPGLLMPIFQYRYGAFIQKLKWLIDEGVTGTAYTSLVDVSWRRRPEYYLPAWRGTLAGELGGVILGHAIHALDLLCFVSAPVRRVFARVATRVNDVEIEDCASASLELTDGSLAVFTATLGSCAEISRHRFCYAHLSAESEPAPYGATETRDFTADSPDAAQRIDAALTAFEPSPSGYVGQFLDLHRAIEQGTEPPVTVADARAVIELITACYYSAAERHDVVLPLSVEHPAYHGWTELFARGWARQPVVELA